MSKKDIHTQHINELNEQLRALTEALLSEGLLQKDKNDGNTYKISEVSAGKTSDAAADGSSTLLSELFEFRNIVQGIYRQLFPDDHETKALSTQVEQLLHDEQIPLNFSDVERKRFFNTLDQIDSLINEEELQRDFKNLLERNNVNLSQIGNRFLLHFAHRVTINSFDHSRTIQLSSKGHAPDLLIREASTDYTPLFFEFKVRKSNQPVNEQMLLQVLTHMRSQRASSTALYFLVIFTHLNPDEFPRIEMRFENMKHKIPEFADYLQQVRLVLVRISHPEQLKQAYDNFIKEYGSYNFVHEFKTQSAPRQFPERNDEFLKEIFEVKKMRMEITLLPQHTPYWRFGLRFSPTKKIPGKSGHRDSQADCADIYVAVGELLDASGKVDLDARFRLSVRQHNAQYIDNRLEETIQYLRGTLKLVIDIPGEHDQVIARILLNDTEIGSRVYILPEYRYFTLFAWADYNPFAVRADVAVKRGMHNE